MTKATAENEEDGRPRPRVMVVDDDRLVRVAFARGLRRQFEVVEANDGREALSLLETKMVDVVVTDLMMAGMGGRAFYAQVRKTYPELGRRILFITGGSVNEETEDFVREMGDAVLVKPVLQHRLVSAIERVLGQTPGERPG